jgi:hypothetical protein
MDAFKESCRYVLTYATASANVAARVLSIQPASRSATTVALLDIGCLKVWLPVAKPRWTGSKDSSCIWSSTSTRELLNAQQCDGNTDDRKPAPELLKQMFGKV